ncbi:hypothetical protein VNO80_12554 [Phaseolus coccineus]|uniref:Uncharacterized protein n=1 Tax=Phaseolus coccineus TaxID=3886 RepID=A0AAN9N543_PHACN
MEMKHTGPCDLDSQIAEEITASMCFCFHATLASFSNIHLSIKIENRHASLAGAILADIFDVIEKRCQLPISKFSGQGECMGSLSARDDHNPGLDHESYVLIFEILALRNLVGAASYSVETRTYDVAALEPPMHVAEEKVGVLLLNLGGLETFNDVQPFLFNPFADLIEGSWQSLRRLVAELEKARGEAREGSWRSSRRLVAKLEKARGEAREVS